MIDTIKIGGEEHEIKVRYIHVNGFLKNYNRTNLQARRDFKRLYGREPGDDDLVTIPNEYFFRVLWRVLEKKGWWLWKKPFRSYKQMVKNILKDELQDIVNMIAYRVLNMAKPTTGEDDSKKKVSHGENIITQ